MVVLKFRQKNGLLHALLAAKSGVDGLSYCRGSTLSKRNYSLTFTVLIYFLRKTYIKASGAPRKHHNIRQHHHAHHQPSTPAYHHSHTTTTHTALPQCRYTMYHRPLHCRLPSDQLGFSYTDVMLYLYTGVDDDYYGSNYYGSLRCFSGSESTKRMDPVLIIIATMDRMPMWP
jgi:hypothetical protein